MNRLSLQTRSHVLYVLVGATVFFASSGDCFADTNSPGPSDEPLPAGAIAVSVASGRTFVGQIDPQTGRELLWLRIGDGPIVLRRPIEWDRVVRVRQENQELSRDRLIELAHASNQPNTKRLLPAPPIPAEDFTAVNGWLNPPRNTANQTTRGSAQSTPASTPSVAALEIDAELGHWTAGVETSGIVVCIHPMTVDGILTPVDGTLEIDLIGQRPASQNEGDGLVRSGRWTETVRAGDFGPLGAVYHLPFQAVHPDFDFEMRAHGMVHARLSVPGRGTFEATQSMVRVRAYSAVRDRLQEQTGSRFAPIEETGR